MLGEGEAVQVQVVVGEGDGLGCRSVGVYSRVERRPEDELGLGGEWTCHAAGVLAPVESTNGAGPAGEVASAAVQTWPPPDGEPVAVDELYDGLTERGLEYGPAFQGLRAVWRRGEEVFAEVALGEDRRAEAGSFGLHPALLDAALHAVAAVGRGRTASRTRAPRGAARGCRLHGATWCCTQRAHPCCGCV